MTMLEYAEATEGLSQVGQAEEMHLIADFRRNLLKKLPFTFTGDSFPVTGVKDGVPVEAPVQDLARLFAGVNPDISGLLDRALDGRALALLRAIVCSTMVRREEIAREVAAVIVKNLDNDTAVLKTECLFQLSIAGIVLPIAQLFLRYLLLHGHRKHAVTLLRAMEKRLLADGMRLSWTVLFLTRNYELLTDEICQVFEAIVRQMPFADRYYIERGDDQIRRMLPLFTGADVCYRQDPVVAFREIPSELDFTTAFCTVAILLRGSGDEAVAQIIADLAEPFEDAMCVLEDRRGTCCNFIGMVAMLPMKISEAFFECMIDRASNMFILDCLRRFLVFAPVGLLCKICEDTERMIGGEDRKLHPFMFAVMPSIYRLVTAEESTARLACGLLASVRQSTPFTLQESVIDCAGFLYVTFKLSNSRTEFINASRLFVPQLKAIIASSLDVDLSVG
jgi:hypothetical protein